MPKSSPTFPPLVPCEKKLDLKEKIELFAEVLQTQAHTLGAHGLSEADFYSSGILQGAIQRVRGQYSAKMFDKRDFVKQVLNHMQDAKIIADWQSSGGANRHDYIVEFPNGRIAAIELKGCMDGNNTNIFERPPHVQEFIIWSVCTNGSADPRKNVWSGIHTRLGPEIISNNKQVDGVVVWDWLCGTVERPCPKLARADGRLTTIGQYRLTPPCIYLFPRSVPTVRHNPNPDPHDLNDVHFLAALHRCFGGSDDEVHKVRFAVAHKGNETVRTTSIERGGQVQIASKPQAIRRK